MGQIPSFTNNAAGKRKFELSHIDTCILLNEVASEIRLFAAVNPHMTHLDSASPVIAVRRASVLLHIRSVYNEDGIRVEWVGNSGLIRNVKVLANLTNIIKSVYALQLLEYELVFRNHKHPVKITNLGSGAVIYGILAAGVY